MQSKFSGHGKIFNPILYALLCLMVLASSANISLAQKKPTALKLDADIDDQKLCAGPLHGTQFCAFLKIYDENKSGAKPELAVAARNEMIDLVGGQVDTYYKLRKDGRKTKIRWLQTLLDFLEIGSATAITIMNGERAKTVVGAALNGFQGGRTAFNKNFEILQTQVLINKMNSNRAQIFTQILKNKDLGVGPYSWYAAKNDLRRYLFAGTFNNALDTLVNETGAEVTEAEKELQEVGIQKLSVAASELDSKLAGNAASIKTTLRKNLKGTAGEKASALKTILAVVKKLEQDDSIQKLLEQKGISSEGEDGEKVLNDLRDILIEQTREGRKGRDIIAKINSAFIEATK